MGNNGMSHPHGRMMSSSGPGNGGQNLNNNNPNGEMGGNSKGYSNEGNMQNVPHHFEEGRGPAPSNRGGPPGGSGPHGQPYGGP